MATTLGSGRVLDWTGMEAKFDQVNIGGSIVSADNLADLAGGSTTATLSSNAATITKRVAQITTEALTTAGGASQAFVITLAGVAATDLAYVTLAGGTNTTKNLTFQAVCTTNTVTVTVYNNTAATAVNGTLIFNLRVVKAS